MADANILLKVRQAMVAYLGTVTEITNITTNIYDGKGSAEKAAPCVICGAESSQEDPPLSGNFLIEAYVSVKTMAAVDAGESATDPADASALLSQAVFNAVQVDDLASQLSAALADFTCQGVGEQASYEEGQDGDCWVETLRLNLYCSPSDL